jgi:peptide/nickel transport system permease protein
VKRASFGLLLLLTVALSALLSGRIWPQDPLQPNYTARYAVVSAEHPLGTDGLGRDVLARSLAGGRVSLLIALSATALTLTLGGVLGLVAAGVGGFTDTALSRFFDALLAFPGFLLILLVVAILVGG